MLQTVWAVVRDGKIELLEPLEPLEGARVLVTPLGGAEDNAGFWLAASERSLGEVWDNPEDDIYAELLAG